MRSEFYHVSQTPYFSVFLKNISTNMKSSKQTVFWKDIKQDHHRWYRLSHIVCIVCHGTIPRIRPEYTPA